ncbi:hypothetical protein [Photobacterium sanguinicancri]|nr:hypothetical protein [Photobacterium sanguinicancri]MDO6498503.1 hypothetical protein [Photobacterium sanguinicancri]
MPIFTQFHDDIEACANNETTTHQSEMEVARQALVKSHQLSGGIDLIED